MTTTAGKEPNHLIHEKSPYLLQHAYNPVEWYPWGDQAILRAKKENKPIILSIGYSTCHWCHVMEKESFENKDIAGIMNQHFVCIKLDREERPDIDHIYMSAVTALTGSGGWPLNVFLTPDLKPFFGGTYFPAEARYQIISWPDLLQRIAAIWNDPSEREKLLITGEKLGENLKAHLMDIPTPAATRDLDLSPVESAFSHYTSQHDQHYGGFGAAPKFPSPVIQNFLLSYDHYLRKNNRDREHQSLALNMLTKTLKSMAWGGMYDHVGGGFHRYSTDRQWHIPHFEKMLYDNAQLIINYLDAYLITREDEFRSVAKATAEYLLRDLHHHQGGFYSAEDADSYPGKNSHTSEKVEGAFYVWELAEIKNVLDEKTATVFADHYGIKPDGNASNDPHGYFKGKNILHKMRSVKETAGRFGLKEDEIKILLNKGIETLFKIRSGRSRPHLDDKILTSWNGLAISAMSRAYQVLGEGKYLVAARDAARFIQQYLYDSNEKTLYRRWRAGEKKFIGMAEDYAFLIQGLIDLYECDFDVTWLDWARELCEIQILQFYDPEKGGFFMTGQFHDKHLILRVKEENDSVVPSANSVSALNLFRLSHYFGRDDFAQLAKRTVSFFFNKMSRFPGAMPQMLMALEMALSKSDQIVIVGGENSDEAKAFLELTRSVYTPGRTIIYAENEKERGRLAGYFPMMAHMKSIDGHATAYVCQDFSCKEPTTDLSTFKRLLGTA